MSKMGQRGEPRLPLIRHYKARTSLPMPYYLDNFRRNMTKEEKPIILGEHHASDSSSVDCPILPTWDLVLGRNRRIKCPQTLRHKDAILVLFWLHSTKLLSISYLSRNRKFSIE